MQAEKTKTAQACIVCPHTIGRFCGRSYGRSVRLGWEMRTCETLLGAFVYKGEPKAWGLSKKGFCAILDGEITVGVSENSPLFEEATERSGYFFRQYPLVDNGTLVDNEPKNKTMRKALCSRSGQILMVVSESDESFYDFAQALVDLGVDDTIYLVGSHTSYGWYKTEDGEVIAFAPSNARKVFKNET